MAVLGDRTNYKGDTIAYTLPNPPYTAATGLPTGCAVDLVTGAITGTPSAANGEIKYLVATRDIGSDTPPATENDTLTWSIFELVALPNLVNSDQFEIDKTISIKHLHGFRILEIEVSGMTMSGLPTGLSASGNQVTGTISSTASASSPYSVTVNYTDPNGDAQSRSFTWTIQEAIVTEGSHFKIKVPDYDGNGGLSYLRLGIQDSDEEDCFRTEVKERGTARKDGWYQYTSGDTTMEVGGDHFRVFHGSSTDYFYSEQFNFQRDSLYNFFNYNNFTSTFGMSGDVHLGGKFSASAAVEVETSFAAKIELGVGLNYSAVVDKNRMLAQSIEQEANDKIEFKVDPDDDGWEALFETVVPVVAATTTCVTSVLGMANTFAGDQALAQVTATVAYGSYGLAIIAAVADARRAGMVKDNPASRITMDDKTIELDCPGSSKAAEADVKIELSCGKAKLQLWKDGKIVLMNEKATLRMTNDGLINLRNAEGGVGISTAMAVFGHKTKAYFGMSSPSKTKLFEDTVTSKNSQTILYSSAGAVLKHPKGGKGGSNQHKIWGS